MNWIQRVTAFLGQEVKLGGTIRNSAPAVYGSVSENGRPVSSEWSAEKAVSQGLKASTWVYASVGRISTALASVPLILERKQGEDWQPEPAHDIQKLLNRPNPFMGRQDLNERWVQSMMLAGNALHWLNIVGGKPVEMWPIYPDTIKPIKSRTEFVSGYEWKIDPTTKRVLPVAEVAHWMFPDPSDHRWGLAPLQAGANAVDLDLAAARWNRAVLANDGKPPMAVFLAEGMTLEKQREAAAFLREQVDGGSVRKLLVLGGASKVQPLSLSASDLDFLNGRRFSREEIAAVFGVPPLLLAFGESATYANLDAAKTSLWEDRVVPLLDDLCQGYMGALFPFWNLTEDTHRIRSDLSGVRALQANLKTEAEVLELRSKAMASMVAAGVPANMAASAAQLPLQDIPGGDVPRQPAQTAQGPPATKGGRFWYQRKDKSDPAAQLGRQDQWVDEIRTKVAQILLEQGSRVASAYAAGSPWETALSLDDWQTLLEAIHTAVIEAEGVVAYTSILGSITTGGGGGTFDVLADGVVDWIRERVGDMVEGITDTSKAALRAEISVGVEAGESTRDIAKRLRALSEEWSGYRAERIARTEVASAFGAAHQQSALQIQDELGMAMVKTWVATNDSRTRDEHAAIDGETVGIDEPFSIGVMQPPGGVNCRCVVTYEPVS